MSLEDLDRGYEEWKAQQAGQTPAPASVLSEDDAVQMGLLHPQEQRPSQPQEQEINNEQQQPQGDSLIDYLQSDREYEQLGFWDSQKDMLKAVGTEFSHFFMPKSKELQYEAKTHYAENMKYLYRYGVGTAAFLMGGEAVAGIKGLGMVGKLLTYKPMNVINAGLKAAHAGKNAKAAIMGANAINGAVEGLVAGALADYNLYRPEEDEGQLADMFGDTDNRLISFLQSNPEAPEYQERLKNVISGLVLSPIFGSAFKVGLEPLFTKQLRALHKAINSKNVKEAQEAMTEHAVASEALDNKAQTLDLWEQVKTLKETADESGEELDKLIIDNIPSAKQADARAMGELAEAGEDIFPNADGTFSLKVTKYQDAYKVTPEEYKNQLNELDPTGELGIQHQNEAVRDTWINRGWIGENEQLTPQNAKKIVKNYKDKFEIDNNINVEFVDGLTVKGQAVEGTTEASKYLGKNKKQPKQVNKTAIAKKKLQIKKLEDKITMVEGGNKEVSDPLDNLKEELRIAKEELKKLETPPKEPEKIKNITIKIDKKAKNPFAVLRSEIEHARDFAKGEVPNQAERHFARYDGLNEAEVAPNYTYKKSAGRAKATELEPYQPIDKQVLDNYEVTTTKDDAFGIDNPDKLNNDYEPYTMHTIRNSEGENLGHIRIKDGNYIDYSLNSGVEKGSVRKLIAKLLYEGKYPNLVWEAKSKGSIKSYERFCREFPDLVDRIEFIDKHTPSTYNQTKGASLNGKEGNLNQPYGRNSGTMGEGSLSNDIEKTGTTNKTNGKSISDTKRNISQGNSGVDERGAITNTDIQPEQLTLDFNPKIATVQNTDELVDALAKGDIKVTSIEDLEATIAKFEEIDPDVSGKTLMDVAQDSDSWFNQKINDGTVEDAINYAKSLDVEDAKIVDKIVRKQIATAKLTQLLQGQLVKASDENLGNIITSIRNVSKYVDEYNKSIASAMGRGLRYQKLNKQALEEFSTAGLSQAEKSGLLDIADVVNQLYKETLNFTTNNPKQIKEMFWKQLEQTEFYNAAMQDPALFKNLNKILDECITSKENFSPSQIINKVADMLNKEEAQRTAWYIKLCDNTQSIKDVVDKYSRATASYMINNVLGIKSLMNNLIGAGRALAFPANKILGGILSGNPYITKEGARTYQNMLVNFGESLRLAKQAFINGDGILTNTKAYMDDVLQQGFNPWSFDLSSWEQAGITAQNIHSFFPRMMMASDEFLSQLNYRSIMRAKAQEIVDNELAKGLIDPAQAAKRIDTKFNEIAFTDTGLPKDFKAYAEAKDILFQVPLDRKLYDPVSGQKVDVSSDVAKTNLTKIGQQFQNISEKFPPLKLIFPFIKTPTNIAQAALETNPLYMALSPDFRGRLFSSNPMVKAKARGHLALCSMMHFAGLVMASQGMITGSEPFDRKEKAALLRTGWRPYSFNINGQYISYKNYVPFDALLASCADFATIAGRVTDPNIESGFEDIFARSMASLMNNYFDQAGFRTNSEKFLDIINPSLDSRKREQLIAGLLQGYLPMGAVVRDVNSMLNPEQTKGETMYERMFKNIAPSIVQADYVRDVFGRRTDIHNYLITQATDDDFNAPEYQEMQRLAELGWTPTTLKGIVEDTKIPFKEYKSSITGRSASDALGEELYNTKIDGLTLRQAVAVLAQDPDYQALPVGISKNPEQDWGNSEYDTQIKQMTLLFKEYYDEAKNKIINERAEEFVNSKGETMEATSERVQNDMEKLINLY